MPQQASLRRTMAGLDPTGSLLSTRKALQCIRWEDGWQGTGPLSLRSLQWTAGGNGLRSTLEAVNAGNPPKTLKQAFTRLGFPIGGGVTRTTAAPVSLSRSLRRIVGSDTVRLRLLSYNTYLLPGLQLPLGRWIDDAVGWDALSWFGIPFGAALLASLGVASIPGIALAGILAAAGFTPSRVIGRITGIDLNSAVQTGAKPALQERSAKLAELLRLYDVCCLSEVYTQPTKAAIASGLDRDPGGPPFAAVSGADASGAWVLAGSGLHFLARSTWPVVRTERIVFAQRGNRNQDSDAWANKGAMLNVLDLGFGQIELFQTHFYYGGGLRDSMPVRFPGISDPNDAQRMGVWKAELDELSAFVRAHHRPANVALITGDFNMDGADVRQYALIRQTMDALGFHDLWSWDVFANHPSQGQTCRFTDEPGARQLDFSTVCDPRQLPGELGMAASYCDDTTMRRTRPLRGIGRFDYLFAARPLPEQRCTFELSRPLRKPFPLAHAVQGETFQSDHLGIDARLYITPRE